MKYDVIVVGAGSAGSAIAARLSEDPTRSVLLLEASSGESGQFWNLGRPAWERVFRATGPTNHHNPSIAYRNMAAHHYSRFVSGIIGSVGTPYASRAEFLHGFPEDYEGWATFGNEDWSFGSVLPYFEKLRTDSGLRSYAFSVSDPTTPYELQQEVLPSWRRAFQDAALGSGYEISSDYFQFAPTSLDPVTTTGAADHWMSMAPAYLHMCRHRLNFTARGAAPVQRILFDGARARGVEVQSGGEVYAVEGDQVILCAGAVGSPQILMLSGIGPAAYLEERGLPVVGDIPGVGRNLRDHPVCPVTVKAKHGLTLMSGATEIDQALYYTATGSSYANDIRIAPFVPLDTRERTTTEIDELTFGCIVERARSFGEITLDAVASGQGPTINYRHLMDPFDRQRMREAVRICVNLLAHASFSDIVDHVISPTPTQLASDRDLDQWMLSHASSGNYLSGTCKMGSLDDMMTVVDERCRLVGTDNVRVADASVMPDIIPGVRNITTAMIGERVAEWFIEENIPTGVRRQWIRRHANVMELAHASDVAKRPPEQEVSDELYVSQVTLEAAPGKTVLYSDLLTDFIAEPVEDGMHHDAERTIARALKEIPEDQVLSWLLEFSTDVERPSFASSVLRCLSSLERPGTEDWRVNLVRTALEKDDVEIREAAIQVAEHWEDISLIEVLQLHNDEDEWLGRYIEDVITSIGR